MSGGITWVVTPVEDITPVGDITQDNNTHNDNENSKIKEETNAEYLMKLNMIFVEASKPVHESLTLESHLSQEISSQPATQPMNS